jgi:hypothetical protein
VLLVTGGRSSAIDEEVLKEADYLGVLSGPEKHAYKDIDKIEKDIIFNLSYTKEFDCVILCLGATATCLASRLSIRGIQALDLGHLGMYYRKFHEKSE